MGYSEKSKCRKGFTVEFHFCETNNAISLLHVYVHICTRVCVCTLLYEHREKYGRTHVRLVPKDCCLGNKAII